MEIPKLDYSKLRCKDCKCNPKEVVNCIDAVSKIKETMLKATGKLKLNKLAKNVGKNEHITGDSATKEEELH
mgnify:CR=1 FL=1|tara:strand:- start:3465 stop:3680 length:216 start_codon:yes stop_codon:yes gene_type:complete